MAPGLVNHSIVHAFAFSFQLLPQLICDLHQSETGPQRSSILPLTPLPGAQRLGELIFLRAGGRETSEGQLQPQSNRTNVGEAPEEVKRAGNGQRGR